MSKGIEETLNIKGLDEILAEEEEIKVEKGMTEDDSLVSIDENLMTAKEKRNTEHGDDMDEIYRKAMENADAAADLANNIDPSKAPRMFEVAGQQLKIALDASASKRDSQLKLMKIIQDQRKLEIEEMKARAEIGDDSNIRGEVVMVEDRNKLLEQISAMKAKDANKDKTDD